MKKQVATWVVSGMLVAGVGIAAAETGVIAPASGDPTLTAVEAPTTTVAPDPTTTTTLEDHAGASTGTVSNDATPVDGSETTDTVANHGSIVSEAAHDHSHDAECGNHGKYVSAVARGQTPQCAGGTTTTAPEASSHHHDGTDANEAADEAADQATETTETTETADEAGETPEATPAAPTDHGAGHGGGHGRNDAKD